MKVDTLRVAVVEVIVTKMKLYLVDVVVVGTVDIMTGIWLQVGRNTLWYTRVVVVVEWEPRIETVTRGTIQRLSLIHI